MPARDPKVTEESQRAWSNGVRPGDPPPQPAPTDATYQPAPGELKETFKCEGATYHGFKGGCVDFQAMSATVKWALKLGLFLDKAGEAVRQEVLHVLFHDGKGPGCVSDCKQLGLGVNGIGVGAVTVLCVAGTRGAALSVCASRASQFAAAVAATILGGNAGTAIEQWCSTNVCER